MNTFSLPYNCRFHLVYFLFSANAQFTHRKHFEHLTCTTHISLLENYFLHYFIHFLASKGIPDFISTRNVANGLFMKCINPGYVADGFCDDETNNENCFYDGGDCCEENPDISYCSACQCLAETSK